MPLTEHMINQHVRYLRKSLEKLGPSSAAFDTNRLTLLFFAVSGLDLLNRLDDLGEETKKNMIEWIYLQQLQPPSDAESPLNGQFGFRGSSTNGTNSAFDYCNLAMTYCALSSLIILGDDLSRVNRGAIARGLGEYQKEDGSFIQALIEEEDDLRITYCAATICFILNDWSTIDKQKMAQFIKNCQSYENGFGQSPGTEAHGGPTFCGIAALYLMDNLEDLSENEKDSIVRWCLQRQTNGFQGRPYKDPDTCYSFWVGATLALLDSFQFINDEKNVEFLDTTQEIMIGGFCKYPNTYPDILHTFFGISALSLRVYSEVSQDNDVQSVFPALNISQRAFHHLKSLHHQWDVKK